MLKGKHYKVKVIAGCGGIDPVDDNVDVQVTFDDGSRYLATFFTFENVQRLVEKYTESGECMRGSYFWASDMILVRRLGRANISKVIADLISKGEFDKAFSRAPSHSESDSLGDDKRDGGGVGNRS
jgi:hypothetical protein